MTRSPKFRLLDPRRLKVHEKVDESRVSALASSFTREGVVESPILVADGSWVILDGHHRYLALVRLGARKVPAWVLDYDSPSVRLDRWTDGPPLSKTEVVERARRGEPFPPKTSRHSVDLELPRKRTPLAVLLAPTRRRRPRSAPAHAPSRLSRAARPSDV